jgi:hypothetical protein
VVSADCVAHHVFDIVSVYTSRCHLSSEEFADAMSSSARKVKSEKWMNKPFAAFDTENPENIEQSRIQNKEWSAAEKIAQKLKEKKMNQLMPVLKALVMGQKGPLMEGEIEKTKDYAKQLAAKLKSEQIKF